MDATYRPHKYAVTLFYAAQKGKTQRVARLLATKKGKAEADHRDSSPEGAGKSALAWAARHGHVDVAQLLIAAGCSPNVPDHGGNTALHHAAGWSSASSVRLMLEGGANKRSVNVNGLTAADLARKYNRPRNEEIIRDWVAFHLEATGDFGDAGLASGVGTRSEGLSDYEKYHQIGNAAEAQSGTSVIKLSRARKRRRDRFFGLVEGKDDTVERNDGEEDSHEKEHLQDHQQESESENLREEGVGGEEEEEEEAAEVKSEAEREHDELLKDFHREESKFADDIKALGKMWHKTLAPFEDADHQAGMLNVSIKLRSRPRRLRTLPMALSAAAIKSAFPIYTDSEGAAFAVLSASDLEAIEEEIRHQRRCLAMKEASMGASHPSLIPTLQKLANKLREYLDALSLDKKLKKRLMGKDKLERAVFMQIAMECLSLRRRVVSVASQDAKRRLAELQETMKEGKNEGEGERSEEGRDEGGVVEESAFAGDREYSRRLLVHASAINDLAELRYYGGNFTEAEKGFRQAVEVVQMASQGKFEDASTFFVRAVGILEAKFGDRDIRVAQVLSDLAQCLIATSNASRRRGATTSEARANAKRIEGATVLHEKASAIFEATLGQRNERVASAVDILGQAYFLQKKYKKAEETFVRALRIREAVVGIRVLGGEVGDEQDVSATEASKLTQLELAGVDRIEELPQELRISLNNVAVASCASVNDARKEQGRKRKEVKKHKQLLRRLQAREDRRWVEEREERGMGKGDYQQEQLKSRIKQQKKPRARDYLKPGSIVDRNERFSETRKEEVVPAMRKLLRFGEKTNS